jgi:septal ring factor EnvC (AmiA/AmiB activator)
MLEEKIARVEKKIADTEKKIVKTEEKIEKAEKDGDRELMMKWMDDLGKQRIYLDDLQKKENILLENQKERVRLILSISYYFDFLFF